MDAKPNEADGDETLTEARLELATEAAQIGVWDWDLATNAFVYSPIARAICGLPREGPIAYEDVVRVTHPDDYPTTRAQSLRALDPSIRDTTPYEYRILRPDGEVRWVIAHGRAVFDEREGEPRAIRYVGTLQDITERRRWEEAERSLLLRQRQVEADLAEREAMLSGMFDAAELFIAVVELSDESFVYVLWNKATAAYYGIPPERSNVDARELALDAGVIEAWRSSMWEIWRSGAARTMEYQFGRAGENPSWYLGTYTPLPAGPSGRARMSFVVIDITARKLAEEGLKQSERRLRFLDQLFDATKELEAPEAIMGATTRLLGEHLDVDVCAYADMEEDEDGFTIRGDWAREGAASIVGSYSLAAFGERAVRDLRAGRPLISHDNSKEGPAFLAIGLYATICMPLIKNGKLTALMAIHRTRVQRWTDEELALLEEVAERSWAHIERVRSEADLRQSEQHFRSLYNSIESGFYIAELGSRDGKIDYRYVEVNPAMARLPGLSDAVGKWRRDIEAAPAEYWFDLFAEVMETGTPARVEHLHEGLQTWFEVYAYPLEDDRFAVLFSDISHRKVEEERRAQEDAAFRAELEQAIVARTSEVQQAEARLRAISESSQMYQGLLTPGGVVLFVNMTALQGIGAASGEVVGRPLWETPWFATTPDAKERVKDVVARAAKGETIASTIALNLPNGLRHFDFAIRPIRDGDGQIIHIMPEAIDVTARVEAEAQLRQSQKLEAMGQLTGGVAHDFNNLLMIMSGGLNMLERKDDPARREMLFGRMRDAVERGAKLTQQLLAFSRKHELAPVNVDFAGHVEAMRELLNRSLGGQVRVALDVAPELKPVYVDPAGLQQALLNLAVNARDAMPEGGVITIRARNGAPHDLDAQCVSLSVVDTGVGMSNEVAARVFEPFFTTKEVGKGSGLGLAQVHGFAQQSGGKVEIESAPGKGTVVTLVLPMSTHTAAPPNPMVRREPSLAERSGAGRALLVEDDADVAALTAPMLEELGWQVIWAASGEEALAILRDRADIDLVFSDVMMPGGINGLELAMRVRGEQPALPVLLTSGYAAPVAKQAAAAGVALLTKPFGLEALERGIAETRQSWGQRASAKLSEAQ
ncbi:MAG: PAS domain S-box protein [Vitreimonas sp.]